MNIKETKLKTLLETVCEIDSIYQDGAILNDTDMKAIKVAKELLGGIIEDHKYLVNNEK